MLRPTRHSTGSASAAADELRRRPDADDKEGGEEEPEPEQDESEEEEDDDTERDEDGLAFGPVVRGFQKYLPQPAPYSSAELGETKKLLSVKAGSADDADDAELVLPEPAAGSGLLLPPALADPLLSVCVFLCCFRNQLELGEGDVALRSIDAALADASATALGLVRVHFALMRFLLVPRKGGSAGADAGRLESSHLDAVGPPPPPGPELAAAVREPSFFAWQETLAAFLVWIDADAPGTAAAVRALRAREYPDIEAGTRLGVLRLLCEHAASRPAVREAIDRRAEWASVQQWDLGAAALLGRVQQRYAPSQLTRLEPLGRDRHGRLYLLLQGRLWVLSGVGGGEGGGGGGGDGASCRSLCGGAPVRRLLQALATARCVADRMLRFTLGKLLEDGALAGADAGDQDAEYAETGAEMGAADGDGGGGRTSRASKASRGVASHAAPPPVLLSRPKYDKVLGCVVGCHTPRSHAISRDLPRPPVLSRALPRPPSTSLDLPRPPVLSGAPSTATSPGALRASSCSTSCRTCSARCTARAPPMASSAGRASCASSCSTSRHTCRESSSKPTGEASSHVATGEGASSHARTTARSPRSRPPKAPTTARKMAPMTA